jgi:hypothetical protein
MRTWDNLAYIYETFVYFEHDIPYDHKYYGHQLMPDNYGNSISTIVLTYKDKISGIIYTVGKDSIYVRSDNPKIKWYCEHCTFFVDMPNNISDLCKISDFPKQSKLISESQYQKLYGTNIYYITKVEDEYQLILSDIQSFFFKFIKSSKNFREICKYIEIENNSPVTATAPYLEL